MNEMHEPTPCPSEASRLLPWLVTGRLEPAEAAQVESHLAVCATCRDDLERQRALCHELRREAADPPASQPAFQKLMARIDATDHAGPRGRDVASGGEPAPRAASTRWLVAVVAAQALGLATLGAAVWQQTGTRAEAQYRTLTTPPAAAPASAPQLRVVFGPTTSARDIVLVLTALDARIVDGPSAAGAYAVAFAPEANAAVVDARLARLRADTRVLLAEPIRPEPGR